MLAQAPPTVENEAEIDLDADEAPVTASAVPQNLRDQLPASFARAPAAKVVEELPTPDITNTKSQFLSLDKCLPNRHFLQLLEIESSEVSSAERPFELQYDKEWLAITRVFANELADADPSSNIPPDKGEAYYRPLIQQEEAWVEQNLAGDKMTVARDFAITAPIYEPSLGLNPKGQNLIYCNPHTQRFCDLVQIPNAFKPSPDELEKWRDESVVIAPDEPFGQRGGGGHGRGGWRGGGGRGGRGHSHGHNRGGRGRGGGRGRRGFPY
jgi:lariat debranching enzyme